VKFQHIIEFWFNEASPKDWFMKSDEFDELIRQRFSTLHRHACQGELAHWRQEPLGRLAEIILLDQFSRNLFRDSAQAFAYDGMALVLAQEAVHHFAAQSIELEATQRSFLYMPYMHSESLIVHEEAVKLFSQPGLENNLDFELRHKAIIERFGRYPHRNALLGRTSTEEEKLFLSQPGSSF
jgi:uncharacterized protein (DUF924 family)